MLTSRGLMFKQHFFFFFFLQMICVTLTYTESMQETVLVEINNDLRSKVKIISKPNTDRMFSIDI